MTNKKNMKSSRKSIFESLLVPILITAFGLTFTLIVFVPFFIVTDGSGFVLEKNSFLASYISVQELQRFLNVFNTTIKVEYAFLIFGMTMTALLTSVVSLMRRAMLRTRSENINLCKENIKIDSLNRGLINIASHVDMSILITNYQRKIVWVNEGFEHITGYRKQDVIGKLSGSFLHCASKNKDTARKLKIAFDTGTFFKSEVINKTKGGFDRRMNLQTQPLFGVDGKIEGFIAVMVEAKEPSIGAVDLSLDKSLDFKQTSVGKEMGRFKAIFEMLPVGLTVTDLSGKLIDCNPAFEKLFGINKSRYLIADSKNLSPSLLHEDGSVILEEDRPGERALMSQVYVNNEVVRVLDGDKSLWISVSAVPVHHDEIGVVVAYVDVTEQNIQKLDLIESKRTAEQANQSKSQFLSNMSHEIRTPMNAILGMLALLRRTDLSPRQAEYAAKTEGAARSLLGLLNDILDFSKVEAGKMTLDTQNFEVDAVFQNLSVILSATAAGKKLEVIYEIDPGVPSFLVGDSMRLQQVLINLGGNAVKFTEHGEIIISLRCISMSQAPIDGSTIARIEFSVKDNGIGIAPENQKKIFEGFTQAEASTTRRFGGTGLGVAICQRLIKLMGGSLQLESELGQGSRFFFQVDMPVGLVIASDLKRNGLIEHDATDDSDSLALKQVRALIVDDSATARRSLQNSAKAIGWTSQSVDSGEKALELIKSSPDAFDLILVDWTMPGMNGWQTCQALKQAGSGLEKAKLFMVTAQGRDMLATRSEEDKDMLSGFVVKPVTSKMLQEAWNTAILEDSLSKAGKTAPTVNHSSLARRLTGFRILVADDNLTNQQVAQELLEDEGAYVKVVGNGLEAINAIVETSSGFDIVLMDLQMPVMDGMTATEKIRKDLGRKDLPIVAMTANAMVQDREACIECGMNDHVGKPFDLDHLVSVILKVTKRAENSPREEAKDNQAVKEKEKTTGRSRDKTVSDKVLESSRICGVSLALSLGRLGGNVGTYSRLLKNFINDLQRFSYEMKQAMSDGQYAVLARQAHTIKGLCGTLGLASLGKVSAQAEKAFDKADEQESGAHLESLLSEIIRLDAPLKELFELMQQEAKDSLAGLEKQPVDINAIINNVKNLSGLLKEADMESVYVVEFLRTIPWGRFADEIQKIDDAVVELNFEQAISRCDKFILRNEKK